MAQTVYAGIDTSAFPGEAVLSRWIAESGLSGAPGSLPCAPRFCGYYLKGPCHHEHDWPGHWANLLTQGWGLAIVYVGQQAPGASPCRRNTLSADQGQFDANDATLLAQEEGLPAGSVIFLDVERVEDVSNTAGLADYVTGWTAGLLAAGNYRPGLYCHVHNAFDLWDAMLVESLAGGGTGNPPLWVAGGKAHLPFPVQDGNQILPQPTDSGIGTATIWQCSENYALKDAAGNVQAFVDLNVSFTDDPSGVRAASQAQAPAAAAGPVSAGT